MNPPNRITRNLVKAGKALVMMTNCTVYIMQYTGYCTVDSVQCSVYSEHYRWQCTVYSAEWYLQRTLYKDDGLDICHPYMSISIKPNLTHVQKLFKFLVLPPLDTLLVNVD